VVFNLTTDVTPTFGQVAPAFAAAALAMVGTLMHDSASARTVARAARFIFFCKISPNFSFFTFAFLEFRTLALWRNLLLQQVILEAV
jgi:hypothetical protein